jgi:UvrB/uvrC motif
MKDKKPSDDKNEDRQAKSSAHDITPVLTDWEYEPGTLNVRKITGLDGLPKLQLRLDLGLLQMEMTGRPDGVRPFGHESLLDYFEHQLQDQQNSTETDPEFQLTRDQCQDLREEAGMYFHRYLSLFVLEDFTGVVRDTARNLRVLDLCSQYAAEEQDRLILEQYRPYIIMMNTRAAASIQLQSRHYGEAAKMVEDSLTTIHDFYRSFGQEDAYAHSNEVRVLKRFHREIQSKLPIDPLQRLRRRLERAIKAERYEEAAKLRDELEAHKAPPRKDESSMNEMA